jgi:cysteine desulfurase/selenocysteine lyase
MREHFPYFQNSPDLVYLDSAATTHKPRSVIDALTRFYSSDYGTVHRAIYRSSIRASEQYFESRTAAARFLGAGSPEEIVFTRGTTDGLNLLAFSLGDWLLGPGTEILITEMEHHSNFVPWQMAARRTGAQLRIAPMDEKGKVDVAAQISPRTKIIAVAHISNVTGTVQPIQEIAAAAHRVGALLVVDGAQAAAHVPIDVQTLGCDFYAFSAHKCYGPSGLGVVYGRKRLWEEMPPRDGGGDMIARVDCAETTYAPPPLRFEAGTPILGSVIALKAALDFLAEHGREAVATQEQTLHRALEEGLRQIPGARILGEAESKGALSTFVIEGVHPLDLATLLDLKGIAIRSGHLCAQPCLRKFGLEAAARASLGIYNTLDDVERFLDAVAACCQQIRPLSRATS